MWKTRNPNAPRCTALNSLGYRCQHPPTHGETCHFHSNLRRRCAAIREEGTRCANNARKNSRTCPIHKGWHRLESDEVLASEDALRDELQIQAAEVEEFGSELSEFDFEDGKDFAKAVLESPEFRNYVMHGLRTRDLPATLLIRLMDYAEGWGKPVEQLEVKDTTPPQEMTPEQIKERARFYTSVINSLDEENPSLPEIESLDDAIKSRSGVH